MTALVCNRCGKTILEASGLYMGKPMCSHCARSFEDQFDLCRYPSSGTAVLSYNWLFPTWTERQEEELQSRLRPPIDYDDQMRGRCAYCRNDWISDKRGRCASCGAPKP